MPPYLAPVERPQGLMLRFVYRLIRRKIGKVPTPIAVFNARMPLGFLSFYGKVSKLDRKLRISPSTVNALRAQVAGLNGCLFCVDAARYYAMREDPRQAARLDVLDQYASSELFTGADRAALDYATELTRDHQVAPSTFERLAASYDERQICDIVWVVASEHLYNLSNIGLDIGSDGLCDVPLAAGKAR